MYHLGSADGLGITIFEAHQKLQESLFEEYPLHPCFTDVDPEGCWRRKAGVAPPEPTGPTTTRAA